MANGKVTLASVDKKVAVLDNTVILGFKEMRGDIGDLKDTINPMALGWKEVARRVGKHHEVFHEHSKIIDDLKKAECPARKVMPDDNGDRNRRKLDQPRYKYILWSSVVTGVCGIITAVIIAILK